MLSQTIGAADARGKSEIVLYFRARAGLSTGAVPIDQYGLQPFGRTVHRRGQAGRSRADDREIVDVAARFDGQIEPLRHLPHGRIAHNDAVLERDDRQSASPAKAAASTSAACGSRSTSSQRYGIRLEAKKSLIACDRGDHWWPTSRVPGCSAGRSTCHRRAARRRSDTAALPGDATACTGSNPNAPR